MLFSSVTHIIIIIIVVVVVVVVVMGGRSALSSASSFRDRDFSIHFMLMTVLYAILNMTPSPQASLMQTLLFRQHSRYSLFSFLCQLERTLLGGAPPPKGGRTPHQCHLSHFTQGDTHTHARHLSPSPSPPLSLSLSLSCMFY